MYSLLHPIFFFPPKYPSGWKRPTLITPSLRFLNPGTTDILDQWLCCRGLSCASVGYLVTSLSSTRQIRIATLPPQPLGYDNQNVPWHCQMSPGEQNWPPFRTTALNEQKLRGKQTSSVTPNIWSSLEEKPNLTSRSVLFMLECNSFYR